MYQAAIRLYMSMQGDAKWLSKQLAVRAMTRVSREDVVVKGKHVVWREGVGLQGVELRGGLVKRGIGEQGLGEPLCFSELEFCDISANSDNFATSAKASNLAVTPLLCSFTQFTHFTQFTQMGISE